MVSLESWNPKYWIIVIDNKLQPSKTEVWKKGIIRHWGRKPLTIKAKEKLMSVWYPKTRYSESDINRLIPKYENCPLCIIGRDNSTFKYLKNKILNIMVDLSIISALGKIPKVGYTITANRRTSEEWLMQFLSTLLRSPIDLGTTTLGKKLINAGIGVGGAALIAWLVKNPNVKNEWMTFFANWGTSAVDPTVEQINEVANGIRKLRSSIKYGDFAGIKEALLRHPVEIESAGRNLINAISPARLEGLFGKFKAFFSSFIIPKGLWTKRLREVPVTHGNLPTLEAEDYKYEDSNWRFRRSDQFSPSFIGKRRLRLAGTRAG